MRYFPPKKILVVGNVPGLLLRCYAVRPGVGGGYGRVFEFVAASDFGEPISFVSAGNRSEPEGRGHGNRDE